MTREERENALHCLRVMVDEEVCEECKLYGTTGTDHCEADCVRVAIEALKRELIKGYWIDTREISTNHRGQIVHEVICSECSGIAYFRSMGNKYIGANLCPNCGADMREGKE